MEEGDSLKDQLKRIADKLEDKQVKEKKHKVFKIPFKGRVSPSRAKKNYVTILKLNDNRTMDFSREQISEQATLVDGIPRIATSDVVFYYKKNPVIIQPAWSVEPFSPKISYEDAVQKQMTAQGYRILLNKMKSETLKPKRSLGGIWVILAGVLVAGGIIYYLFFK